MLVARGAKFVGHDGWRLLTPDDDAIDEARTVLSEMAHTLGFEDRNAFLTALYVEDWQFLERIRRWLEEDNHDRN